MELLHAILFPIEHYYYWTTRIYIYLSLLLLDLLLYSGFTALTVFISAFLTLDNSNIGFNLPIIILFPIIDWISSFETKSNQYTIIFIPLFFLLLLSFLLNSLIIFFICYECLIILLFFILSIFISSFYRIRTAFFFISSILRLLSLFFLLSNNSFPGSINYIGELLALLPIISIDVLFTLFFLFHSFLSTLFWFIVLNRKLPYHSSYYLYYIIYYWLLYWLVFNNYVLGIYLILLVSILSILFTTYSIWFILNYIHSLVLLIIIILINCLLHNLFAMFIGDFIISFH